MTESELIPAPESVGRPDPGWLSREDADYRQTVERRLTALEVAGNDLQDAGTRLTKLETTSRNMRWIAGVAASVLTGLAVGAFFLLQAAINAIGG